MICIFQFTRFAFEIPEIKVPEHFSFLEPTYCLRFGARLLNLYVHNLIETMFIYLAPKARFRDFPPHPKR